MARINTTLNDGLEERLRKKCFEKFGNVKGSIQKGLEEAITEWIKK